jgi:translation initiation factor 5A
VPNVKRKDFQLIGLEDGFLSLMDDTGDTRDDLKCPEDAVGEEIAAAIDKEMDIMASTFLLNWKH